MPMLRALVQRAAVVLCLAGLTVAALCVAVRLTALGLSDRTSWSQFATFVPAWILWAGALAAGFGAGMSSMLVGRGTGFRWALRRGCAGFLTLLILGGVIDGVGLGDPPDSVISGSHVVRVVHWNCEQTPHDAPLGPTIAALSHQSPDVVVLTSRTFGRTRSAELGAALGLGHRVAVAHFVVLSRWEITDHAAFLLSLGKAPDHALARLVRRTLNLRWRAGELSPDGLRRVFRDDTQGTLVAFTIRTPQPMGDLRLGAIDLPSYPLAPRWHNAGLIAEQINRIVSEPDPANPARAAQAPLDIILGDFNTPFGAASLSRLAPGMRHAAGDIGVTPDASWPRSAPMLHIDHTLIAPRLRAVGYRVFDPLLSHHMAQAAALVPAELPPGFVPDLTPRTPPSAPAAIPPSSALSAPAGIDPLAPAPASPPLERPFDLSPWFPAPTPQP